MGDHRIRLHGAKRWSVYGLDSIERKQNSPECFRQDNTIQPKSPIANVPRLELDSIFEGQLIPPVYLPQSGHAGPGREDCRKVNANTCALQRKVRTRANQPHFALQYI